jgi:RNA-directed DNA polymerase
VVVIDLERFFDRVNHDVLMGRLARRIGDKRLLKLIRAYLETGMMSEGVVIAREEGTPQGGPLSPLLSNILLDDLDKMLEQRGHRFCRYADDCNIYVGSRRAGERVMASVTQFLERKLRLKVNTSKSAVAQPKARKFLGQRVLGDREHTYLGIHPKSAQRAKVRIREITRRNRGVCLDQVLHELSSFTNGWLSYHRHCRCSELLEELDKWVRRRLRCYIWKQWKLPKTRARNLRKMGIGDWLAYGVAYNGYGLWKVAGTPALTRTLTNRWLRDRGFASLQQRHRALASA